MAVRKVRERIYELLIFLSMNNADMSPVVLKPGTPPMLRMNQGWRTTDGRQEPSYRALHGHYWLVLFILKKAMHPLAIGVGIAGTARLFGWL